MGGNAESKKTEGAREECSMGLHREGLCGGDFGDVKESLWRSSGGVLLVVTCLILDPGCLF